MKAIYPIVLKFVRKVILSVSVKYRFTSTVFPCLFAGIILIPHFSCKKEQSKHAAPAKDKTTSVADAGSQQNEQDSLAEISGIPIADPGNFVPFDSIGQIYTNPLKGTPKVFPAHPNVKLAGNPKVIPLPEQLTVITPGKNGVPLPQVKPVKGKVVPALQPKPVPASPLRTKEDAIAHIQILDIDLGIGTDVTTCVLEDSRGFLWIGTTAGAIRYDGKQMALFTEKEGLSHNHIKVIVEDKKGNLWFATRGNGVTCYDGTNFIHFTEKEGLGFNFINCMIEDSKGNLWFGLSDNGLIRYDGTNLTLYTQKEGLSSIDVFSMMEDSKGNLWIGTTDGGVSRFDGDSFTHFTEKEGLCSNLVYSISEDKDGLIWFGTYKGASRYDGTSIANFTENEGLIGNFIKASLADKEGNLWFANGVGSYANKHGLSRFDGKTFTHFTVNEGLGGNVIWDIATDSEENLWLTTAGGLTRFDPDGVNHFNQKNGLPNDKMMCFIVEDGKDGLWLGTWRPGLIHYDGNQTSLFTFREGLYSEIINQIIPAKNGNLWLDAGERGATYFDGQNFTHYVAGNNFFRTLTPVLLDSRENLWLGTPNRLIRKDSSGFTLFSNKEIFGNVFIMNGMEDRRGHFWFGSDGGGLIRFDGTAFTRFTEKEGLSDNTISDMLEDRQGNLWFGTKGGVNRYDGDHFTHFTEKEGLGSNSVNSLVEDNTGNIWVCRYHGISVLMHKDNWPDSLKETPKSGSDNSRGDYQILNYDSEDGFNGKNYTSIYLDKAHQLWMGGEKGLTILDPKKFQWTAKAPGVKFEHIEIMEQYIDFGSLADTAQQRTVSFGKDLLHLADLVVPFYNYPLKMTLPSDLNHLTFYFSATNWVTPQKIRYSYFIENVDKTWSLPQSEPWAEYRNLPPGKYTIQVKAKGAAQVWSQPVAYTFTIRSPWHRTWLAYSFYAFVLGGLLFAIRRYELNRQFVRAEAHRFQELDEVKSRLYTNITHEFRTPLTVVIGMSDKLLQGQVDFATREGLHLIKRNGRQLLELVNQILDLAKLESGSLPVHMIQADVIVFLKYLLESFHSLAETKNISLHFHAEPESVNMDFDTEKLRQIIGNLLHNAIKFTPPGGRVTLSAETNHSFTTNPDKPFLRLTVSDTGRGISADQLEKVFDRFHQVDSDSYSDDTHSGAGTGIGLTLTRELVKLLGGQISVESELGAGTIFTVMLPVNRKADVMLPEELQVKDSAYFESLSNLKTILTASSSFPNKPGQANGTSHFSSAVPHPSLLVIEDNSDVIQYLTLILQNNYQLLTAANGRLGLEIARKELPDLILCDVMMPEMDGLEVCRQLKNDLSTSHIPIVLLTAKADFDSRLEGLKLGADAYLAKPFEEKELKIVLKKLHENRERLRQFYTSGEFLRKRENTTSEDVQLSARDQEFLQRLVEAVESNLSDPNFTAEILSNLLFVSYNTCLRKVKALVGMNVNEYIHHIRLNKAAQWLLEDPERSVVEIAEAAGYNSHSYFNRVFKHAMGCTPSEYRKA